ncbi:MAG: MFS transporter [Prevotellaceae bacterium]|nr:MFS transporter [Prevotellaceae bacterium]MDY3855989.1 MFS transporter [Bacteroidaceae bacterium]
MKQSLRIDSGIPRPILLMMIIMAALTVANLHYNVPLLDVISRDLNTSQVKANLITVFTQAGYAMGLLFIVALGDLYDARRVIVINFVILILSLLIFAMGRSIYVLWGAGLVTGLSSVAVQMYIPMVSKYSLPADKVRHVGYVVSGVTIGVLLGRVVGGLLGGWIGWRTLYCGAAGLMALSCIAILLYMPPLEASFKGTYRQLMASILDLVRQYPQLLAKAGASALAFASFNTLWACLAFHMAAPPFYQDSRIVGLLGLCGIVTAIAVADIGRYVNRVGAKKFNIYGFCIMIAAWAILYFGGDTYGGIIAGIILIDIGQQCVGVSNQSTALALAPQGANRINTLYMTIFFIGGSLGTFLAGQGWNYLYWMGVVIAGLLLAAAGLLLVRLKG